MVFPEKELVGGGTGWERAGGKRYGLEGRACMGLEESGRGRG